MPQTVDRIDFACPDVDPARWPQLRRDVASQFAIQDSGLRFESGGRFTWNDTSRPSGQLIGLLAQEVDEMFPEL